MRFLILLSIISACFLPGTAEAESAILRIKVKIISKTDWDRIQADENLTVDNFNDDQEMQFELTSDDYNVIPLPADDNVRGSTDSYFIEPYSYADLAPESKFPLMDINDDGFVTRREYLRSTGTPLNDPEFDRYDRNGDGILTYRELQMIMQSAL